MSIESHPDYLFWKYVIGEQWDEPSLKRIEADPDWLLILVEEPGFQKLVDERRSLFEGDPTYRPWRNRAARRKLRSLAS